MYYWWKRNKWIQFFRGYYEKNPIIFLFTPIFSDFGQKSIKLVFTKKKKETRRFIFLSFSFDFLFLFLSQINKRDLIFFFTLLLFPFLFLKTYKLQVFAIAWFKIFETLSNNYNTNPLINWSYISNGIIKNILCFLFWES